MQPGPGCTGHHHRSGAKVGCRDPGETPRLPPTPLPPSPEVGKESDVHYAQARRLAFLCSLESVSSFGPCSLRLHVKLMPPPLLPSPRSQCWFKHKAMAASSTALLRAATFGCTASQLRGLLAQRADIYAETDRGQSPLQLAAKVRLKAW